MITENLPTLVIHKLTKEQYERELAAGRLDENAIYLTPDEDLSTIFVMKSGGTMTGKLTLFGDPVENLHAATKQYVDNKITCGTTDLEDGVSALETGKIYFYYEE